MATGLALIPVARASDLEAESKRRNEETQNTPVIQGLAAHVRERWDNARTAKRKLEERMLQCLRQRNGEYDPEKAQELAEQGCAIPSWVQALTSHGASKVRRSRQCPLKFFKSCRRHWPNS
jgi:hypothetical protein